MKFQLPTPPETYSDRHQRLAREYLQAFLSEPREHPLVIAKKSFEDPSFHKSLKELHRDSLHSCHLKDTDHARYLQLWKKYGRDLRALATYRICAEEREFQEKWLLRQSRNIYYRSLGAYRRSWDTCKEQDREILFAVACVALRITRNRLEFQEYLEGFCKQVLKYPMSVQQIFEEIPELEARLHLRQRGSGLKRGLWKSRMGAASEHSIYQFLFSVPEDLLSRKELDTLLRSKILPAKKGYHSGWCLSRKFLNELLQITKQESQACQMESLGPDLEQSRRRADRSNKHRVRYLETHTKHPKIRFRANSLQEAGDSAEKRSLISRRNEMRAQAFQSKELQVFVADSNLDLLTPAKQQKAFTQRLAKIATESLAKITQRKAAHKQPYRNPDPVFHQILSVMQSLALEKKPNPSEPQIS